VKRRNGFVSNSSATSFCLYGACVDEDVVLGRHPDMDDINDIAKKYGLEVKITPYSNICIGKHPNNIKNDQTGAQFRNEVKKSVSKLMGEPTDVGLQEQCWHG
jgi:hypothetical protein